MSELNEFSRAELLLGKKGIEKLRKARVAVFGIGGVGSFAAEALARGGVGHLALVDGDVVSLTNINRQLIATQKTIGRRKTSVMAERIHEILPETEVVEYPVVYGAENRDLLDFASYDYIVDAIDTVTSKLILIEEAKKAGTEVISSMGTGNKFDPTRFEVADISKTSVCNAVPEGILPQLAQKGSSAAQRRIGQRQRGGTAAHPGPERLRRRERGRAFQLEPRLAETI